MLRIAVVAVTVVCAGIVLMISRHTDRVGTSELSAEVPRTPAGIAQPQPQLQPQQYAINTVSPSVAHRLQPPAPDVGQPPLLQLDRARLVALEPGDTIVFPVPQVQQRFTGSVISVSDFNGDSFISGKLDGSEPFGFTLTVGSNATVATLNTPHGTFELSGNREFAWLIDRAVLEQRVDPNIPDTVQVVEVEREAQ
jgi:hypothetical protein